MHTIDSKSARTCVLCEPAHPVKQRGAVLLIALIALVALTLAGIALMRSIDTGNVIAGNLAFKQAALHATDMGVEQAVTDLPNIVSTSVDADIANQYFATIQPVDKTTGIPTTINWSTAHLAYTSPSGNYKARYVIDRLCQGPLPVTDIQTKCVADTSSGPRNTTAGATNFTSSPAVYYRVTVQVTGPRNTSSLVQTILSY